MVSLEMEFPDDTESSDGLVTQPFVIESLEESVSEEPDLNSPYVLVKGLHYVYELDKFLDQIPTEGEPIPLKVKLAEYEEPMDCGVIRISMAVVKYCMYYGYTIEGVTPGEEDTIDLTNIDNLYRILGTGVE